MLVRATSIGLSKPTGIQRAKVAGGKQGQGEGWALLIFETARGHMTLVYSWQGRVRPSFSLNGTSFWGVSSKRSCRSFQVKCSTL